MNYTHIERIQTVCSTEFCSSKTSLPVGEFRIAKDARGLILLWFCGECGCGWRRIEGKEQTMILLNSGLKWPAEAEEYAHQMMHPAWRAPRGR